MSNYGLSDLTHCFRLGLPCLYSKLQLPILVTAPGFLLLSSYAFYTDSGTWSASAVVLNSALASSRFLAASGWWKLWPKRWYPRRVIQRVWRHWHRNGYSIVRVLLVVLWWPCTWAGVTEGRRMRSPLPSLAVSRFELEIGTSLLVWFA